MPLQLKCNSCGRTLVLEDVFQGAHCRCKFCRHLVEVPRSQRAAARSGDRPEAPAIIAPVVAKESFSSPTYVEALPGRRMPTQVAVVKGKRIAAPRFTPFRVAASFTFIGATLLGFVVWNATENGPVGGLDALTYSFEDDSDASDIIPAAGENPRLAILRSNPHRSFFGVPIEGRTVGYVIDGDASMAPYLDKIAFVTNSVNNSYEHGSVRFGIVQAVENPDGARLYEVFEPSTDLAGATTMLHGRLASGVTDLARAFAVTDSWYADELFLVVSKRLPPSEIEYLTQMAQQSGAVTHVIAFGAAAEDADLAEISDRTHGQYVPVTDDLLNTLVARHEAAAEAAQ